MIGRTVGQYQIIDKLGEGGMGTVYLGQDMRLQRKVALKFLPAQLSQDEPALERFEREAQLIASLNHPNIIAIHSIEDCEGLRFLAMELVEGDTLDDLIPERGLPLERFLELAVPIATALGYSHDRGVIHADLKPTNVMADRDGNIKVLDFGLARLCEPSPSRRAASEAETLFVTEPDYAAGTVPYMSPEQARGLPLQTSSDVFSLGVVLYEMASGRRPFSGASAADLISSILRDTPAPIAQLNPGLPVDLDRLLQRCLAKDPRARFQSAQEVLVALEQLGSEPSRGAVATDTSSIAVLPFTDMSHGEDRQFFCDGLAEEISTSLTKIKRLRVAARTSAFALRDFDDVRKIGEILSVRTVLQGSVRTASDRLRITVELSDARSGYQIWSEHFDREASDVFAVQDDIALAIAKQLRVSMDSSERAAVVRRHTESREAYNHYLKGRFYWNRRFAGGLRQGMEYFERALAEDPSFALPHCGLADSFAILGFYNILPPAIAFPQAKSAAGRALELDPTLAESHAAIGLVQTFFEWDLAAAETAFLRAFELDADYGMGRFWYAFLKMCEGRKENSLREIARAREADPLSLIINGATGYLHYLGGQPAEALEAVQKTLEMDESFGAGQWFLGLTHLELGRMDDAVDALARSVELLQELPLAVATLGVGHARAGDAAAAEQILSGLVSAAPEKYVSPYYVAALCLAIGHRDDALMWLRRAYNERNNWLALLDVDPLFAELRGAPEFESLVAEVGVSRGSKGEV